MGEFSFIGFIKGIYVYEPRTPEEIEIMRLCKQVKLTRISGRT